MKNIKNEIIENVKNVKSVTFHDNTDYDPALCNNGGKYGYWTRYSRTSDHSFIVSYGTTAEFAYCPKYGNFGCDCLCPGCESDDGYEIVTEAELIHLIDEFEESDDEYITFTLFR